VTPSPRPTNPRASDGESDPLNFIRGLVSPTFVTDIGRAFVRASIQACSIVEPGAFDSNGRNGSAFGDSELAFPLRTNDAAQDAPKGTLAHLIAPGALRGHCPC